MTFFFLIYLPAFGIFNSNGMVDCKKFMVTKTTQWWAWFTTETNTWVSTIQILIARFVTGSSITKFTTSPRARTVFAFPFARGLREIEIIFKLFLKTNKTSWLKGISIVTLQGTQGNPHSILHFWWRQQYEQTCLQGWCMPSQGDSQLKCKFFTIYFLRR